MNKSMLDISVAATNKFFNLDRIVWALSPYLQQDETYKILDEMELRAKSKLEGNYTNADCFDLLRQVLGNDRYNAITKLWEIENQQAVLKYVPPEERKDVYYHKTLMIEVSEQEAAKSPESYIKVQVMK